MNKFVDFFFPKTPGDKRATKNFGIAAIVLVVVILINVFAGTLSTDITQIDISGKGIYKISDTSKEIINELEHDIELIMVYNGEPDNRISKFVNTYAAQSNKISARIANPAKETEIMTKYSCVNGQLVVFCEDTGKFSVIDMMGQSDALMTVTTDPYTGTTSPVSFDADGQITSAVRYVTGSAVSNAYVLTGHGEFDLSPTAINAIEKNNIALSDKRVNLLMDGGIPADCSTLICYAPTNDLANDEVEILRNYLKSGGNFTLILNSDSMANFNSLVAEYGLEVRKGFAGDTSNFYSNYVNYYGYFCIAPEFSAESPITKDITSSAFIVYPFGMKETTPARDTIVVDSFMTTTDTGLIYADENNFEENVKVILGATATENSDGKTSCLTVMTTASLIEENIVSAYPNMANIDVFINAVTANLEVDAISIPPVSMTATYNNIAQTAGIIPILFMYVLPIGIIIYGVVYCIRRKRK